MIAAAIAAALILAPATGPAHDPKVDEWHTWVVSEVFTDTPRDAGDVAWPQSYLGPGQLEAACGWVQQDRYKGKRSVIDAILADNTLTYGEDFGVVKEWRYVYTGPCSTPEPTPTVTPTPEPTATPTPEPTATPEPSPTPSVTPEPTPTPTVTPEPTPEPSQTPTQTPTPSVTAGPSTTATPTPGETEGVGPTPQYTEAPTAGVRRLAETGAELAWPFTIGAILTIAAGAGLLRRRKEAGR